MFLVYCGVADDLELFGMGLGDPRMRRISNGCYLIALYSNPFFGLIPVVEAFQLQSRRKRKYLQLPVSTFQKCWLSTFQI